MRVYSSRLRRPLGLRGGNRGVVSRVQDGLRARRELSLQAVQNRRAGGASQTISGGVGLGGHAAHWDTVHGRDQGGEFWNELEHTKVFSHEGLHDVPALGFESVQVCK